MRKLLRNSCTCPDGTELISRYGHDYSTHLDKNGETYMLDGGLSYVHCSINKEEAMDTCLYDTDDHKLLRRELDWGSYGPNGDQPIKFIKICDLSINHIENILECLHPEHIYWKLMNDEIEWRKDN